MLGMDPNERMHMPRDLSPDEEAVQSIVSALAIQVEQTRISSAKMLSDDHPALESLQRSYDSLKEAGRQIIEHAQF